MTLRILSVQHDRHGLSEVQRISQHADTLSSSLQGTDGVAGVLTLATCNRVEFVIDAPEMSLDQLRESLASSLATQPEWSDYEGAEALTHLFRVASGLSSMVVGEREIAGQLRRALRQSTESGHSSGYLVTVVNAALRTARRVGSETTLQGSGRSVVSVGLAMTGISDWAQQRVLLVGTGRYAGAALTALRDRGVHHIVVNSASGRADEFAQRHGIAPADLSTALAEATLVVTCRGTSAPVIRQEHLASRRGVVLLDLSLQPDVDPSVARLPGITLVNLAAIQAATSPSLAADSAHAEQVVADSVTALTARLDARAVDPGVVALRESMLTMVDDEVARLPKGRALTADDCAQALRRLTTRLLHAPSTRARQAAAAGRSDQYLDALNELYGIDPRAVEPS